MKTDIDFDPTLQDKVILVIGQVVLVIIMLLATVISLVPCAVAACCRMLLDRIMDKNHGHWFYADPKVMVIRTWHDYVGWPQKGDISSLFKKSYPAQTTATGRPSPDEGGFVGEPLLSDAEVEELRSLNSDNKDDLIPVVLLDDDDRELEELTQELEELDKGDKDAGLSKDANAA